MSERIRRLEENIVTLEEMRTQPAIGRQAEWALRYGLLESIQIVIDLACELVSRRNLGSPTSYRECVEILARNRLIDEALAQSLVRMVGLRNLLVHDYDEIDIQRLTQLLDRLSDFREFSACYLRIINDET